MTPSSKLPIIVCEFHQEVLEYIHRYIARKRLPFDQLKMVHFDSHPDLAFPNHLSADDCFNKDIMYNELDISDWILPLVYAGHLKTLIWLKPPWAQQIDDVTVSMKIGKEVETGRLKLTCTEDYFLEDGMFTTIDRLQNIQPFNLKVCQIEKLILQCQQKYNLVANEGDIKNEPPVKKQKTIETKYNCAGGSGLTKEHILESSNGGKNIETFEHDILQTDRYVLDIDLDYFSVMNPFLQDYTESEYKKLKTIYKVTLPTNKNDENILLDHVIDTRNQINNLERTIQQFAESPSIEIDEHKQLLDLLREIKERKKGEKIDWALVHSAGMTTDLPHHISSDEEVDKLIDKMVTLIKTLPRPSIITIARSTIDEYCPPDQIESIQEKVLKALNSVYEHTEIILDYKDTSRII